MTCRSSSRCRTTPTATARGTSAVVAEPASHAPVLGLFMPRVLSVAGWLAAAGYLLVACPLDETTRGLIDGAALARMPAHAVVINVARGPVIDEDALFDALKERRIGGAVIDTWYTYPSGGNPYVFPSRHPFQALDNVMMTPHVSGWSRGLLPRRFRVIAQNLNRLARGEPLLNLVQAPLA